MNNKKETDHYEEIAAKLKIAFEANLRHGDNYNIRILIGEVQSALRTLIANGYNAGVLLSEYSKSVHRLHLDISILIEHKNSQKFELVIFEIKKVNNLGLNELSQLIGYCLVSKCRFGVLMNIDKAVSRDFSIILDADKDITNMVRLIDDKYISHEFGVMVWNSETQDIEYTQAGAVKTIPDLVAEIERALSLPYEVL